MISIDTNIFVYAVNADCSLCKTARDFLYSLRTNTDVLLSEYIMVELYMCLRNPAIFEKPLGPAQASGICTRYKENPHWQYGGYESSITNEFWKKASMPNVPFRRVIDIRLALTLTYQGVTEFATVNTKDFENCGFLKVWNPLH